ncbi:MAG: RdgB/HAM1 family non-canonical purine NTP pyrophosphatase [Bacteroidales bacterium]|nr:RdgB/HAM1 family non-canonical purine NTP pyrophosphatase [Bacteroidales bacterium]
MKQLIFASHNKHKASEINALLNPDFQVSILDEVGISDDIPETADTLAGNALIKARFTFEKTGKSCFADDTGLEVDALNGAPGVYSARFAGPECNSDNNIDKLLSLLQGSANRSARFRTVIAYITDDGKEHMFEGIVNGKITSQRMGTEGFGYDPVFMPDEANGLTFAQMPLSSKNTISHRGRAIAQFVHYLKNN